MELADLGCRCLGLFDRLVRLPRISLSLVGYLCGDRSPSFRRAADFCATSNSYNLFSTNVILASIAFVYWPDLPSPAWPALIINLFTLLGSVFGQLLFGFLADYYGRTRLYGIELVLVIVSTIGVATSSYGYSDMNFLALFTWVSGTKQAPDCQGDKLTSRSAMAVAICHGHR